MLIAPDALGRAGYLAAAGSTALAITLLVTPLVRSFAVQWGWVARPLEDRWGKRVIARLGGAAMFAGVIGAIVLWVTITPTVLALLLGICLVFGLGLWDDLRRMRPYTKLFVQLLIGCVMVMSGIRIELVQWPWLSIPLSVLWFVFVMNAFNLLDNMDGLAAGVGAIAAGFCAIHGAMAGQWSVATIGAIVSGACLGFLRYNFPPAKIFMGDSGSHLLGMSLAALALMGSWHHSAHLFGILIVPTLLLAVPIFDTCFVTAQRLAHRRHPFVGGQDHVSHRLAILGLTTRQTVLALYAVSASLATLSVVSTRLKLLPVVALWVSVLTGLVLVGRYLAKVRVYLGEAPISAAAKPAEAERPATFVDTMLMYKRRLVEVLADFCLVSSAYVFAYLLRFEGTLTSDLQSLIAQSLPVILLIKLTCFAACGLYRGVWRYLSLVDVLTVFKAVSYGSVFSTLALVYGWRFEGYSRAVFIIDWMVTFFAIAGARVVERLLDESISTLKPRAIPVLILGAGDTGELVLRYLKYESASGRRVLGFLDDDVAKHGSRIHGAQVLGGREELPRLVARFGIREVLIAISDPPGELLQHIQAQCEPLGVTWKVVTAGVTDAV